MMNSQSLVRCVNGIDDPALKTSREPTRRHGSIHPRAYAVAWAFILFALSSLGVAQSPHTDIITSLTDASKRLDWSYRKDVREVYFLFSASVHGKFVVNLTAEDINVLDGGSAPEQILAFHGQEDLPLRMGLLIDTSPSVNSRFGFEKSAAQAFLTEVVRSRRDEVFIMGFSDFPEPKQMFTNNQEQLGQSVSTLVDHGDSTTLFDAIVEGCRKLRNHPENQFVARTLVVVSDGEDNSSRASLQQATLAAQDADVTIYAISTRTPWHSGSSGGGDRTLRSLAEETGGRALFPGSPRKFQSAFTRVADELHSRYAISYRPAHFALDGSYRRIQISARKSGKKLTFYGRKGYYATVRPDDIALEN